MDALGARHGAFIWLEDGGAAKCFARKDGVTTSCDVCSQLLVAPVPFIYDFPKNRSLTRDAERNLIGGTPRDEIDTGLCTALDLGKGLAVPVRTGAGEGQVFLEGMPSLSIDHLDIGAQLAADLAAHIQRHALMMAAADSAEARSRIVLARDLHDSVVQFLAGAAFRLEAMKRSEASGREARAGAQRVEAADDAGAGRAAGIHHRAPQRHRGSPFADVARDLQALAGRLARQWDIECEVLAAPADMMVPTDLHLDAHQLVREAVANAVRHAGAKSMRIGVAASRREVRLDLVNDGKAYPASRRADPSAAVARGAGRAGRRRDRDVARHGRDQGVDFAANRGTGGMTRILLADDHPMIRTAIEVLLRDTRYELAGTAANGQKRSPKSSRLEPDILLLDLEMPGAAGWTSSAGCAPGSSAAHHHPDRGDRRFVADGSADPAGAGDGAQEFGSGLSPRMPRPGAVGRELDRSRARDPAPVSLRRPSAGTARPALAPRERQLIRYVRQGLRNREIAKELGVTEGTVKVYLHAMFEKLGVKNRTELAIRADEFLTESYLRN